VSKSEFNEGERSWDRLNCEMTEKVQFVVSNYCHITKRMVHKNWFHECQTIYTYNFGAFSLTKLTIHLLQIPIDDIVGDLREFYQKGTQTLSRMEGFLDNVTGC